MLKFVGVILLMSPKTATWKEWAESTLYAITTPKPKPKYFEFELNNISNSGGKTLRFIFAPGVCTNVCRTQEIYKNPYLVNDKYQIVLYTLTN